MPIFGMNQGMNPNRLPVDQIKGMKAQGMDNNQIIQALQRDGYSSSDIFDAMNQSEIVPASGQAPNPGGQEHAPRNEQSQAPYPMEGDFMSSHKFPPKQDIYASDNTTEELVEAIIDEKWNELVKDLNKIIEWKNSSNNKILSLEQKFSDLKQEFDKLHSAIISKIDDYDKNITNVGSEVRAMEKVFSKVLPVFTENVSELSKITRDIKKKK